jgi:hypothetical protein
MDDIKMLTILVRARYTQECIAISVRCGTKSAKRAKCTVPNARKYYSSTL